MNDSAKLRRQLHLIRCLDKPYTYPSLVKLNEYLLDHDIEQSSIATVERDINDIRTDYDISVTYDRRRHGYFLDLPTDDEDISNFREFVRLLERRERLELLTQSGRSVAQYIQLEQPNGFRGFDLLAPLWNAMQRKLAVTFQYQAYTDHSIGDAPSEQRQVEPGLLFEYRNRWYLDGYDLGRDGERTFGLDRITDLSLTPQPIQSHRNIDYRAARRHVIGVTAPPGSPVERVVLRFSKDQMEYVRSLPLHPSQTILAETPTQLTVALSVILNPELEREILAYGEEVEVLEPVTLRERISERIKPLSKIYI